MVSIRTMAAPALALAIMLGIAGCGGDNNSQGTGASSSGGGGTPTPTPTVSPTPTPTPSPVAFDPVPAALFADPLYNSSIVTLGHGFSAENTSTYPFPSPKPIETFVVTFEAGPKVYRAEIEGAPSGLLYQVWPAQDGFFGAQIFIDAQTKTGFDIVVNQGGRGNLKYIARLGTYATVKRAPLPDLFFYGYHGVAQPTLSADMPTTGAARYKGELAGFFSNDAGATFLNGAPSFDISFGNLGMSGSFEVSMNCFMGCLYPGSEKTYAFAKVTLTSETTFEGELVTDGAPSPGKFRGLLAGPNAAEVLIEVEFPYYHPEQNKWVTYAGIIAAKRE